MLSHLCSGLPLDLVINGFHLNMLICYTFIYFKLSVKFLGIKHLQLYFLSVSLVCLMIPICWPKHVADFVWKTVVFRQYTRYCTSDYTYVLITARCDSLTVWQLDSLTAWQFDSLTVQLNRRCLRLTSTSSHWSEWNNIVYKHFKYILEYDVCVCVCVCVCVSHLYWGRERCIQGFVGAIWEKDTTWKTEA